jgi:hypothetical protein
VVPKGSEDTERTPGFVLDVRGLKKHGAIRALGPNALSRQLFGDLLVPGDGSRFVPTVPIDMIGSALPCEKEERVEARSSSRILDQES